jgi:hypothetical protein
MEGLKEVTKTSGRLATHENPQEDYVLMKNL